jgi:hypothetical protein
LLVPLHEHRATGYILKRAERVVWGADWITCQLV